MIVEFIHPGSRKGQRLLFTGLQKADCVKRWVVSMSRVGIGVHLMRSRVRVHPCNGVPCFDGNLSGTKTS